MGLLEHAKEELKYLRNNVDEPDEMQDLIEKNILEIIGVFSKQHHSGSSARYCIPIIEALLNYRNITPLTGDDDEWIEVASRKTDGVKLFQNKRNGNIFKQSDRFNGQAYNIEGKVFSRDKGKTWFTNYESFTPIEFPYLEGGPKFIVLED